MRAVRLLGALAALGALGWGGCGERQGAAPASGGSSSSGGSASSGPSSKAPPRERAPAVPALDPAAMVAAMAAKRPVARVEDPETQAWGLRLREALFEGGWFGAPVTVRSWSVPDPAGGQARVLRGELAFASKGRRRGASGIRFTACPARPALAAAEESAYLQPLESAGLFVRPLLTLEIPAFVTILDDPELPTTVWHRGCLVVRAQGVNTESLRRLHVTLEEHDLYGEVPPLPLDPEGPGKEEPPPPAPPGEEAPGPSPAEAPASPLGRWVGGTERERLSLELRFDGTFEAVETRRTRRNVFRGRWSRDQAELALTTTHENDKAMDPPYTGYARLVGATLELRENAGAKKVVVLTRGP
jgi:hypothetical protein